MLKFQHANKGARIVGSVIRDHIAKTRKIRLIVPLGHQNK